MKIHLQPDLQLLYNYGYLHCTEEELHHAIDLGRSEVVETYNILNYETEDAFKRSFTEIIIKYELEIYMHTLGYIALVENDGAYENWSLINGDYDSRLRTKQLAQLLMCMHETSDQKLQAFKLTTLTDTVKLTDSNLIRWIGGLIAKGLSTADFTLDELGQSVYRLIADDNGAIHFDEELDYTRISYYAKKRIIRPSRQRNKILYAFLSKVLYFLEHHTDLTTSGNSRYTNSQMNFLFDLAELFGWLNRLEIDSEPQDYMYAFFQNNEVHI